MTHATMLATGRTAGMWSPARIHDSHGRLIVVRDSRGKGGRRPSVQVQRSSFFPSCILSGRGCRWKRHADAAATETGRGGRC